MLDRINDLQTKNIEQQKQINNLKKSSNYLADNYFHRVNDLLIKIQDLEKSKAESHNTLINVQEDYLKTIKVKDSMIKNITSENIKKTETIQELSQRSNELLTQNRQLKKDLEEKDDSVELRINQAEEKSTEAKKSLVL